MALTALSIWAQQPPAQLPVIQRRYLTNLADEDWSFLSDPKLRHDPWDPLKFIPFPREGWYLTLGGEARLSPQGLRVRGDEVIPSALDNYFLQRYLLAADFHLGPRFRVFTELQSGILNGRIRSPRPSDQDLLELHQGFFQFTTLTRHKRKFSLRLGRQELNIGSGRLISPSQGLNVKRSFDGLSAIYAAQDWAFEGGIARLVRIRPGIFDDPPDSEQDFWGLSFTRRLLPWKNSQFNFYYLGINRKYSIFAQGIGPERRHTFGSRLSGRASRLDYNYDLIVQFGSFRDAPVRAWAVSTDTGFSFKLFGVPLRAGVNLNSASGDRDPNDPSLQSFNPLFPGSSYSGIVGLLGPTNLSDITPSLRANVRRNLLIAFESPSYFRTSLNDGVYTIDQRLVFRGIGNPHRYVGSNPGVIVSYQPFAHITFTGAITRFQSGQLLSDTFARNGFGFYSIAGTYRF
ncbi:MAG: alginate export family protein [Acidobacteria bacterium]|nr:alginate export family protein [Acidobacteriota bacterium]